MDKTESQILCEVYERVRALSKMFIASLKDIEVDNRLEINNTKFNSAYWILAHLVWTEHFLIVRGVGDKDMEIEWLDEYGFGTDPDKVKSKPPFEEILRRLDEVHAEAVKIISGLTDNQIEEDNHIGASFGGSKSKRNLIIHAIRHEPMHIGQLSWILKANGTKLT